MHVRWLTVSPSSFIFFFLEIPYTVRSYEVDPLRQTSWNEWKQPCRRVQFSSWLEMLHRGKSHFFVWSGLISQRYPKGKTVIFIFLLGDIVGSVTWVGTLVLQLLFEENWLCPGLWEIFINMEDSAWAHLTFSKWSWLCEKENCLGVVKNDLSDCLPFDWKMDFALFLSSSAESEPFVCERSMLWVFSTGYSSKNGSVIP